MEILNEHLRTCRICPQTLDRLTEPLELMTWVPILRQLRRMSAPFNNPTAFTAPADEAILKRLKILLSQRLATEEGAKGPAPQADCGVPESPLRRPNE